VEKEAETETLGVARIRERGLCIPFLHGSCKLKMEFLWKLSSGANLGSQMKILSFEQDSQLFSAALQGLSTAGYIPNFRESEKICIPEPIGILTGKKSIPWKLHAAAPDGGGGRGGVFFVKPDALIRVLQHVGAVLALEFLLPQF
jgi:hypothetical protein